MLQMLVGHWLLSIGRHLSESDICPKAELGISDRCRCRTGVVFGDICPNFGSYCNLGSHSHFTSEVTTPPTGNVRNSERVAEPASVPWIDN